MAKVESPDVDEEFDDLEEEEHVLDLVMAESEELRVITEDVEREMKIRKVEERVLDYYFDTGYVWFTVIPEKTEEEVD